MQLRGRLLFGIVIALLIQSGIAAGLGIYTFVRQARQNTSQDLAANVRLARRQIEQTRHRLYREVVYLKDLLDDAEERDRIVSSVEQYAPAAGADDIALLEGSEVSLIDPTGIANSGRIAFLSDFDVARFRFPASYFYVDRSGPYPRLQIVTGARVGGSDSPWTLLTTYEIDRRHLDQILPEAEYNLAVLLDRELILTTFPAGRLGSELDAASPTLQVGSSTQQMRSIPISANLPGVLRLAILQSTLSEQLYIRAIVSSFMIGFIISLVAAVIVAVFNTTHLLAPFRRLHDALADYFEHGTMPPASVATRHSHDDVAYLANAFQTLVHRLISEQATVNQQLEEISYLHEYNEAFVSAMQAGILVVDSDKRIEYSNSYARDLLGASGERLRGEPFTHVVGERFNLSGAQRAQLEEPVPVPNQLDGLTVADSAEQGRRFVMKLSPIGSLNDAERTLVVLEDVTRTEELWRHIFVAEKISSLGLLSAGMAHEINNPLGSIGHHADYLLAVSDDPEQRESLLWIKQETRRIGDLIQRILSFAREDRGGERHSDVRDVWRQAVQLAGFELKRRRVTAVDRSSEAEPAPVAAMNPSELKQVLINLVLNAAQASSQGDEIAFRCWATAAMQQDPATTEDQVHIEITDTGHGIPNEVLDRIFDPFFTTEASGTGLGLPLAHVMVSHARGSIRVQQSDQRGTRIRVTLPRAERNAGE